MDYTQTVQDILASPATSGVTVATEDHPSGYLPDSGLVDAVNVALILGKPLLLTGDPGTGKTQLAYSLAWQLASRSRMNVRFPTVEKFETKSTSLSRDLFYTFDAIRRFQAARESDGSRVDGNNTGSSSNAPFITYNALGRALLRGLQPARRTISLPQDLLETEPVRTVVLIDEVDKASRDFPNDLLNELADMYFRIPELDNVRVGGRDELDPDCRPIVVVTSNSERNLPDPFLRRCIYYHIPFPDETRLSDILVSRLPQLAPVRGKLTADVLRFFMRLRDRKVVSRPPSPAELIEWLTYMLRREVRPSSSLSEVSEIALAGTSTLAKDRKDQSAAKAELEQFLKGK